MVEVNKSGPGFFYLRMLLNCLFFVRWYQNFLIELHHSDAKHYDSKPRRLFYSIFLFGYVCHMSQICWQEEILQARHYKEIWKVVMFASHYERTL